MIYFVATDGFVKIGFSQKPKTRFRKISVDTPHKAFLIGVMNGDTNVERKIHERFLEFRYRGEWFWDVPEIRDFVDNNAVQIRRAGKPKTGDSLIDYLNEKCGNLSKLADALGVTPGAIAQWKRVPAERVPQVSRITGIPREQLRPDVFGEPIQ